MNVEFVGAFPICKWKFIWIKWQWWWWNHIVPCAHNHSLLWIVCWCCCWRCWWCSLKYIVWIFSHLVLFQFCLPVCQLPFHCPICRPIHIPRFFSRFTLRELIDAPDRPLRIYYSPEHSQSTYKTYEFIFHTCNASFHFIHPIIYAYFNHD